MDTLESYSLEEAGKNSRELLEQICSEKGLDLDRVLELSKKLIAAAKCAAEVLCESFSALRVAMEETVFPAVKALSSSLNDIFSQWDSELFWMVPPHIKHLAFHHPKARVRNKNWNRMWKIRERYMKNDTTKSFPH